MSSTREYTIVTHDLTKKFTLQKGFTDFLMYPFLGGSAIIVAVIGHFAHRKRSQ